jgi:hypothetical protein
LEVDLVSGRREFEEIEEEALAAGGKSNGWKARMLPKFMQ